MIVNIGTGQGTAGVETACLNVFGLRHRIFAEFTLPLKGEVGGTHHEDAGR